MSPLRDLAPDTGALQGAESLPSPRALSMVLTTIPFDVSVTH